MSSSPHTQPVVAEATPSWACFCWWFLPVKQLFFPTVAKCFLIRGRPIVWVSSLGLYNINNTLQYESGCSIFLSLCCRNTWISPMWENKGYFCCILLKHFVTVVEIWCYMNKTTVVSFRFLYNLNYSCFHRSCPLLAIKMNGSFTCKIWKLQLSFYTVYG